MKKHIFVFLAGLILTPQTSASTVAEASKAPEKPLHVTLPQNHQRHCIRHTGSRIHSPYSERLQQRKARPPCIPVTGRAYSREDIVLTGASNLQEALQRLDTSIY